MAGYEDTRQMIINTLTNRLAGTEIQPEDHQEFALAITDYVRSVELLSGNAFIGFAEANTTPVQSDKGQCFYISTVGPGQTVNFVNFIDSNGDTISVSSTDGKMSLVTLIWNTQYWSSQVTTIDTNWSIAQQSGDSESMVMSQKAVTDELINLDTDIKKRYGEIIENSEWVRVILDVEGKILFGIREDGSVYLSSIDDLSKKKFTEIIGLIQDTEARLGNSISETIDELNKSKVNGVSAERDAEEYVIGIKTQGGTTFINNIKIVTSEKVGLMSPTMLQYLLNNTANLQEIDTHITENNEWVRVITDADGRILFGIREDGEIYFEKGIPKSVKTYVEDVSVKTENQVLNKTRYNAFSKFALDRIPLLAPVIIEKEYSYSVPYGTGFVCIDDSGKVLFNSQDI